MLFVDGLRGLAALTIVLPHAWVLFAGVIQPRGWRNTIVFDVRIYAVLAVQVFFVLSGFVIAFTLRDARVTPALLGRFLLRRSIRLDPPYAVSMLICLGMMAALGGWHTLPPARVVLAHLFYLQDLLGFGEPINHICWTLCIEIQMYLFFCAAIGLIQAVRLDYHVVLTAVAMLALGWPLGLFPSPLGRFFLANEYCFLAGAVAWWWNERSIPRWLVLMSAGTFVVAGAWHFDINICVAFATAGLLALAGSMGKLNSWLKAKPWQFFGAVSYALYLTHQPVCDLAARLQRRSGFSSAGGGLCFLVLVYLASLALAYLLRITVELPSIRLSHRLKVRGAAPVPTA
jgi:peptidoglycan/LPS O-acetylase OafA/YrhL